MKHLLILVAIIVTLVGCATGTHSHSPTEMVAVAARPMSQGRASAHVVQNTSARGQNIFGRQIFAVGERRFTTLAEFKTFIESLPPGSVVKWDSGCISFKTIPLLDSDMTIKAFKEYCKEHDVRFVFICGY
jgi:hypothetical protein